MKRLRCRLRTFWGTVTMPEFWRSLIDPPLVVFSGHIWSEPEWSAPRWHDGLLIEVDLSHCVDCGYSEWGWRSFLGTLTMPPVTNDSVTLP